MSTKSEINCNQLKNTISVSRPRSNSSPGNHLNVQSFAYKEGMKVVIVGTENVQQRVPQLIGKIGIIKEAPGN